MQHLGGERPPEGYEEMVCGSCMASRPFLEPYTLAPMVTVRREEEEEGGEGGKKEEEEVKVDVGEGSEAVSTTNNGM